MAELFRLVKYYNLITKIYGGFSSLPCLSVWGSRKFLEILGHDLHVEIPTGGVFDPATQRPKIKKMPWVPRSCPKTAVVEHPLTFWRLESGEATCAYSLSVKKP